MFRRLALTTLTLGALTGCGEELVSDIVAVPARPPEATPVTAFRATLGEAAIQLAYVGSYIDENGDVDLLFTDGSTLTGHVNVSTGEFVLDLEIPGGYYLTSVHDEGAFDIVGGYIVGASYREEYTYISGTQARWEIDWTIGGSMELDARDIDRGTKVHCLTRFLGESTRFDETWDLENGYHEDITTIYRDVDPYVEQTWLRDELATAVNPDRTGQLEFAQDGSGEGRLVWLYDHGITNVYEIVQEADGDATATLVYEDPGTDVTPDGEGTYFFEQDNSGEGTYLERYDDGSEFFATDEYGNDDSVNEVYTFDDAATPWTLDLDGGTYTNPDGSGFGTWNRHDADGPVESCSYEFDSAGTIFRIDCSEL